MKVNEYIADFFVKKGITRVYGLMGGGASGLNDGFIKNPYIDYISFHHEQSAGHAAIGESKSTGRLAVVNPTTGCGGTNCITSVLNAWQDGVPVFFISGNVKSSQMTNFLNEGGITIRKYGIQEHDIIKTVKSITKKALVVYNANDIPTIMNRLYYSAISDRPGPVWLDIPSDIQQAEIDDYDIDVAKYIKYNEFYDLYSEQNSFDIRKIQNTIKMSERPLVLAGNGIIQAKEQMRYVDFIKKNDIPMVYTYGASDILPFNHPLVIGAIGIKGSRAGNFALQQCDSLLILGCSLNVSHIGYDSNDFARNAYRMHVDIDNNELRKKIVKIDLSLNLSLKEFFDIIERANS